MSDRVNALMETGEQTSAIAGGIIGVVTTLILAIAAFAVAWLRLRGTVLGHLITRAEHLEKLLREVRDQAETEKGEMRTYYERRIESIVTQHRAEIDAVVEREVERQMQKVFARQREVRRD